MVARCRECGYAASQHAACCPRAEVTLHVPPNGCLERRARGCMNLALYLSRVCSSDLLGCIAFMPLCNPGKCHFCNPLASVVGELT